MRKTTAFLASGVAALALAASGCGGSAGTSGVGTVSGTVNTNATTTGGVAGAQFSINQKKLNQQANQIIDRITMQLNQVLQSTTPNELGQATSQLQQTLRNAADRLGNLNLQNQQLKQDRTALQQALRSAAKDLEQVQTAAQNGNYGQALSQLGNLRSLNQVQQAINQIQETKANDVTQTAKQRLAGIGGTIAINLQQRLISIQAIDDPQQVRSELQQLAQFLQKQKQNIQGLSTLIPKSLQDEKQAIVKFLTDWRQTVQKARSQANTNLTQAKKTLASGSAGDIQQLLKRLNLNM